jgi:hypothetical protein
MPACPLGLAQTADGSLLALFADGLDTTLARLDAGEQQFCQLPSWTGRREMLTVRHHIKERKHKIDLLMRYRAWFDRWLS